MEQNLNSPQIGMTMSHPSLLKEGQFLILVNGNIQTVDGNFTMITNDNSNILATRFKDGYKVIGTNVVPSLSTTFFFLYNPLTNDSEIGFIFDTSSPDKPDFAAEQCCQDNIVEPTPLEQTIQYPLSQYYTFVNAKCLNFDIDHPVTSWIKLDDCNVRIYFNDFKNPPRYIDYKNFQKIDLSNCPLIETDQLDCDKIKIFPETCYPVVDVVEVIPGGQNTAGVYQFAICYSDVRANKLTDYFYVTNPIPLGDQAITVNTAYPVYKSFKLEISNLNTDFRYFNLAVLKTTNNVTSVFLVETFEVNSSNFEYIYTGVDKNLQADLSIDEILAKRPYYNKAKITTEDNGYLFLANLEEDRIVNLQPVVNSISLKWQTIEATDGDYANPVFAQNYVGYLGDEVYPFGISFTKNNGKQTNVFPFIGRAKTDYDKQIIDNNDVISYSSCGTEKPNERWQVYNTAPTPSGITDCIAFNTNSEPQDLEEDIECTSNNVFYILNSPSTIPVFYQIPDNLTYPPTNSDEAIALQNYINTTPALNLTPYSLPSGLPSIGLCPCDTTNEIYKQIHAQDPNATIVPIDIQIDLSVLNNSVEINEDPYTYDVNTYGLTTLYGPLINNVPNPGVYPYDPNPCRFWYNTIDSNKEKNQEKGYLGWIDQKDNKTSATAAILSQSTDGSCSSDTWGAFIAGDSWYNFYCTNQDGVAGIMVSTANNGFTVTVYNSDQNGNVSTSISNTVSATLPYYEEDSNTNGKYILLHNLTYGSSYFVKVEGFYNYPGFPDCCGVINKDDCKHRVFKICVVTPNPSNTTTITIPGVAQITRQCKVKYKGYPIDNCKPTPNKRGEFAYWESTETYPCNEEVWGDLAGKPIRHFKFPDQTVVSFFEEKGTPTNGNSIDKIYPKGIVVDIKDIKNALNQAVSLGLITPEELNNICGYRIYRGNRRGNQSIIAKGLLYDVWEYKDNIYNTTNKVLFPNFPFNDNRSNDFIKTKQIKKKSQISDGNFLLPPYQNQQLKNNKYTFDAPNLSFNNPGLGTEIKLEGEQTGLVNANFIELRNNTKYQYIGAAIISAAVGFSSVEAAFESLSTLATATLTQSQSVFGTGASFPLGLILALVSENILTPIRVYSHYAEWYDIIKKFAPFRNYAFYYTGVGKYNKIEQGNAIPDNTRRTIANAQYIKPGILNVKTNKGSQRFNNFKRESSVFIELKKDSFFNHTVNTDTSRPANNNILKDFCSDKNPSYKGNLASYYGSLKNPLVNQYGQIDNIEWIDTGYNGKIDWSNSNQNTLCDTIFGGDTYITRFTKIGRAHV